MLLPEKEDRYANRIRNRGDGNDFYRETQRAWHVDYRINGEKIADNDTRAPQIAAMRNQIGAPERIAPAPKIGIANITK